MDVFPQDLGPKQHMVIVRRRASPEPGPADLPSGPVPSRSGPVGRLLARESGVAPGVEAAVLDALRVPVLSLLKWTTGSSLAGALLGLLLAALGDDSGTKLATSCAVLGTGGLAIPSFMIRRALRRARQRLTAEEVEALIAAARDDLERNYLTLVLDAMRQTVPADGQNQVRDALRTLGGALDRLPAVPHATDNADDLRREAGGLLSEAAAEPDAITAGSLERRAQSLLRRANTVARSALVVRRAAAVRQEIAAQVDTLRASLGALDTDAGDLSGLVETAEAVRRVAVEADSVAAAREELDRSSLSAAPGVQEPARTVSRTH